MIDWTIKRMIDEKGSGSHARGPAQRVLAELIVWDAYSDNLRMIVAREPVECVLEAGIRRGGGIGRAVAQRKYVWKQSSLMMKPYSSAQNPREIR